MVTRAIPIAAALLVASAAGGARAADVFSPGDLSRAHASLSGLDNCTKCHPAGEQLSQQRCVDCHKELAPRLAAGAGFHGRLKGKDRDCWSCHHEHQGRDFALVDWGAGGQRRFDHARTGAPLAGKHAQVACERCHDPRVVADDTVKSMLARTPGRKTFLGAPAMSACASCHFDEHRGQLGNDCRRCHGENAWKPAGGFDHGRTSYALTGKHGKVACARCHATVADSTEGGAARTALTRPVSVDRFVRYKPVTHASCLDCHKDVHEGRFGSACARCHTPDDWKRIVSGAAVAERGFHDKTRYPLTGAHADVKCVACHGPFPGEPARFKGLAFQACTDCHADGHAGQLAKVEGGAACDRCHDVRGYQPAKFGLAEHAKTRYPLEGAHRVVACVSCHPSNPAVADRLPAPTRAELVRRGRPIRMSQAVFAIAGDLSRCETCHADPHAGQLIRPQGCAACHAVDSFRKVRFDHAKDSRFALAGKHATAACRACHRLEKSGAVETVRYRPLDVACASCHADPHAGQFAARSAASAPPTGAKPAPGAATAPTDCARCHSSEDWKKTKFQHEPPFTTYALAGKHAKVACDRCHAQVDVGKGVKVRRYKPLPRRCDACHVDFHRGAFQGMEQLVRASAGTATSCDRCHTVDGWREVGFAHQRTGFPLRGAHAKTSCKSCHPISFTRALGRDCSSCHRDVHQGRLGARCAGCHDEYGWATKFDADVHRRGNFPLSGKHAFISCQECHGDRRDRGFTRSTPQCITCHQKDYDRTAATAIDHRAAGFPTSCQQCHDPWRFKGAAFGQHEACFKIASGPHAGISCLKCHTALSGFTITGTCNTGTASCTRCHGCGSHPSVAGFACADRKCYECHRFSSPGSSSLRAAKKRSP